MSSRYRRVLLERKCSQEDSEVSSLPVEQHKDINARLDFPSRKSICVHVLSSIVKSSTNSSATADYFWAGADVSDVSRTVHCDEPAE